MVNLHRDNPRRRNAGRLVGRRVGTVIRHHDDHHRALLPLWAVMPVVVTVTVCACLPSRPEVPPSVRVSLEDEGPVVSSETAM